MSTVTLAADARPAFVQRFDAIRLRTRLTRLAACAALATTGFLVGLLALAAADYAFELPRIVRLAGFATLVASTLALFLRGVVKAWRRTAPTRTAASVEDRFPELGQSVRTLLQYEHVESVGRLGAAPSLAAALADDTSRRAGALPLESVVPVRALLFAGVAAAAVVLTLFVLTLSSWEWETALRRTLLDEQPWTTLSVAPGATSIREGESLTLSATLAGRTDREVTLFWRNAGEEDWAEQRLSADDVAEHGPRLARYESLLPRISDPLEYRLTAGMFAAGPFAVSVRRPLTIESVAVDLAPPEYTGLPPRTEEAGDVTAIEGSRGRFRIELDRTPAKAEMLLSPLREAGSVDSSPQVIPLSIEGKTLVAELDLTTAFDWSIRAEAEDGIGVRENGWRVRIRRDGVPQIWFESPHESLEVHTLAEILMGVRARDDFGLAQAGIVFQVNNEQEHTLLLEEFAPQTGDDGRPMPQTRASLERKLPLEFFELTEKDSVTYRAFAVDNRPGEPHHVETDLRFIDVRPFRRIYRYADMENMPGMTTGRGLMTLGEIVRRERFVLNRTLRAEKQLAAGEAFDFSVVDRLAATQAELAQAARRLAEFLSAREIDGADLMFQAEQSMLAAADSLSAGKFDTAALQERDALRFLIEARNTLEIFLTKNPQRAAEVAEFDRQMSQKLRRDRDDDRPISAELRRLARQEREVAQGLRRIGRSSKDASSSGGGDGTPSEDSTDAAAESPQDEPTAEKRTDPSSEGSDSGSDQEPLTPQELEDRQSDIAKRTAEVAAMVRDNAALTELIQTRMQAAVETTERAAGELSRGDIDAAAKTTDEAAELLSELARQVEGLLAGEAARRIAEARDLAEELADRERQFAADLGEQKSEQERQEGAGAAGEPRESDEIDAGETAREAERIARSGETLLDLLNSVTQTEDPAEAETAGRLEQVVRDERVGETVTDLQQLAARIGSGNADKARDEATDLAGRLDAAARRLDRLYRSIVAPRIEELARLEMQAALLRQRLDEIEDRPDAIDWTRDAEDLLDELTEVPGLEADDDLRDALAEAGFRTDERGRLVPPIAYRHGVEEIVEDLQSRIQELLLADVLADGDGAVPPAYRDLVDRYYQILSSSALRTSREPEMEGK